MLDIVNKIAEFRDELYERNHPLVDTQILPDAPPPPEPYFRACEVCEPPELIKHVGTIEEARALIDQSIIDYSNNPFPDHILVLKVSPGVGKTYAAVQHAERLALAGHHVFYAGPRHDFFEQILNISNNHQLWYEWLPRQAEGENKRGTCIHTDAINRWMGKGYKGSEFCKQICRFRYMDEQCVYHAQKHVPQPITYGNHKHVTLGHPGSFDFIFGDESPIQTFMHRWDIGVDDIRPYGMDNEDPITHLIEYIRGAAANDMELEGPALIQYLGGPDTVLKATSFHVELGDLLPPKIRSEEEADNAPSAHLFDLASLLEREAKNCKAGGDYPHRIIISKKLLTLFLRYNVNEKMPPHVIWLDATANEHVYTEVFHRPVKVIDARPTMQGHVYQVSDRANGKSTMMRLAYDKETRKTSHEPTIKTYQALQLVDKIVVDYGYKNPTVITFKDIEDIFSKYDTGHFFAERGTNAHQDADSLFIIGTPQPSEPELLNQAKCIFFGRNTPFNRAWITHVKKYQCVFPDGSGRQILSSGLWGDPDLMELLSTTREDEIIQSAHRSRPVQHNTDIWLLTNLPIDDLPPERLFTMTELLGAPEGVNIWNWQNILKIINEIGDEKGFVTVTELMDKIPKIKRDTIYKYFDLVEENSLDWEVSIVRTGKRGMPPKMLVRKHNK